MKALQEIYKKLKGDMPSSPQYIIPESWNFCGFSAAPAENDGEIIVNAAAFFGSCIENIINRPAAIESNEPVIYSMLPRAFSAWKHFKNGEICGGSFVKSLCLLPLLADMGVNTIYLLPIFSMSRLNKKGELPSPYAIRDPMQLDESLNDPLLEGIDIDTQFQAFCDACHLLGMKLILDFVFRTVARDCVLVESHPDWFYWVKTHSLQFFAPPTVENLPHTAVDSQNVELLYSSAEMAKFFEAFAPPPSAEACLEIRRENPDKPISELLDEKLGISVMRGFADTINDPQPPWTDVTFLRLYFDNTPAAKRVFGKNAVPFIAQDGIKSSLFGGEKPNLELWHYLENIIPYYIERFEIDGARIDMAHALPSVLNERILSQIRAVKDDFILWSEEFSTGRSIDAARDGCSFFTGGIWDLWESELYRSDNFNRRLYECLSGAIPAVSALETPDTPRAASALGEAERTSAIYLAMLLPNTVAMINNGQEFDEIQPMNLGLKSTATSKFLLPESHPLFGKLALFDNYYFNWRTQGPTAASIRNALKLRQKYARQLLDDRQRQTQLLRCGDGVTPIVCFDGKSGFLAVLNRSPGAKNLDFHQFLPEKAAFGNCLKGSGSTEYIGGNEVCIFELVAD